MRSQVLLLLGGLCLGCAEQHGGRSRTTSHADAPEAGQDQPLPGSSAEPEEPDVYAVLDEFLTAVRDFTKASCDCRIEAGDYTTEEECLEAHSTVLSWRDCAGRGLSGLDPTKVSRQLGCQTDDFYMRTECMNEVSCSAGTEHALVDCQSAMLGCPQLDEEIWRALSEACSTPVTEDEALR
jgi:hypothetical protein